MCQFKSGIAVRISESEVEVRTSPLEDSHTKIREKFLIREDNFCLSRYNTPVELLPTKLDFEDKSCWELVFDAGQPDWWEDGMTEKATIQLLKAAKEDFDALMSGKEYLGSFDLNRLTSIPNGFNPTVGGDLYLDGLTSIPSGFNPTVGGNLWLEGLTSIPSDFNPTVGGDLYLDGLTIIPDGFNPTVGRSLYLRGLTIIPDGFNPTVGGSLWLRNLTSLPSGFNPTVGGNLWLEGLKSIPDSVQKNVKGKVYLGQILA